MAKKKGRSGRTPAGITCPDCGRRVVGQQLVHDPSCPAARALDDLMVQDADWFTAHPGGWHRCRWITAAERMELPAMAGHQIPGKSVIHVAQIGPGVRTRSLYVPGDSLIPASTVGLFGHPSTFTLLERAHSALPRTRVAVHPSGLQVMMFHIPEGSGDLVADFDGLVVLRPGDALPVPHP